MRIAIMPIGILVIGAMMTGWALPADACSPPLVCKPKLSFAAGAQLPATAPGIPILLPTPMQPPYEPVVPVLLDGAGQPMAIDVADDSLPGWKLIKPLKGLQTGKVYTLRLPGFCQDANGALLPPEDVTFTAVAKPDPPVSVGALELTALAPAQVSVWTSAGSCTVPIQAARGVVALQPDPALLPWLPLARAELWLDGEVWTRGLYGDLPLAGATTDPGSFGRTVRSFFVACGEVPAMADAGLAPGLHHVDLRVHVAGATSDAAYLYGDLTVGCIVTPGDDATTFTDSAADATSTVAESGAEAKSADNGCAAGAGGGATPGWLAAVVAVLLVTGRRVARRRAEPTAS